MALPTTQLIRDSFPPGLRDYLDQSFILKISDGLFSRLEKDSPDHSYKRAQVIPTDPEWNFVWKYFHHNEPIRYGIERIYCIHNSSRLTSFTEEFQTIASKAKCFQPDWRSLPMANLREIVHQRWLSIADTFAEFQTESSGKTVRQWEHVTLLPLWQGTKKHLFHNICETGLTFFGKKIIGQNGLASGSTDAGFFGSGIYLTNSSRYASDIYSDGLLVMAWVSMREPFPVVGGDMQTISGEGAYSNFDTHFVPVVSRTPENPFEPNYYPINMNNLNKHLWDEYVVFQENHALPRFMVQLYVKEIYLNTPSNSLKLVHLIGLISFLLGRETVSQHVKLTTFLKNWIRFLLIKKETNLSDKEKTLYHLLIQLLGPNKSVQLNKMIQVSATVSIEGGPISVEELITHPNFGTATSRSANAGKIVEAMVVQSQIKKN